MCVFLGRPVKAPQVRRVNQASKSKIVHTIHIKHRDEVEAPFTDWLQEAYELSDTLAAQAKTKPARAKPARSKPKRGTKKARSARKTARAKSRRT